MKKIINFAVLLAGILFFAGCCLWPAQKAQAKQAPVRVGVFELNGFYEKNADGLPTGYGADYLSKVAELTGWTYEYVWTENWNSCVDLLRDGKVDLIAPAQRTPARLEEFAFGNYQIGVECGALMTLGSNRTLIYENFEDFHQISIGCVDTLVSKDRFLEYARLHHFTPHFVSYKDTRALIAALNAGEVDAILANLFAKEPTMKVLAKYDASPIYFMMPKDADSLSFALDEAQQRIKMEFVSFESNLLNTYYPDFSSTPFTKAELDYIASAPVLRVGCRQNFIPISYLDDATGEVRGVTHDILEQISAHSGLQFEYVALPQTDISYQFLQENQISLVSSVEYNEENLALRQLKLSIPYLNAQKFFVCAKGNSFDASSPLRVAVVTGSGTLEQVIRNAFPNFEVLRCATDAECFEAVRRKDADLLLENQYVIDYYLTKPLYAQMSVIPAQSLADSLCISPVLEQTDGEPDPFLSNPLLISVLNKSIRQIPEAEFSRIIIKETLSNQYVFTVQDFLYQYRVAVISICAVVLCLFFILCYSLHVKRRSLLIIRKNEEKLRHITNNINGGVIVLTANDTLRITYANNGFLKLLQCEISEYFEIQNQKYITYVHPDDIALINSIKDMDIENHNRISVRLRIMRKDGQYVPVLFNGTLAETDAGERELYCVIMDISEQERMAEQITLEQRKYSLLLKYSGDIMFEADCIGERLKVSPPFLQKFGWNLSDIPCVISQTNILRELKALPEDLEKITPLTNQELALQDHQEYLLRILKTSGEFLWCRLFLYPMVDSEGQLVHLLGRILDVDAQTRQLAELEQKSRTDSMTGLLNKSAFYLEADAYLASHPASNAAVVFLDIDNFKQINDSLGHMAGDRAIVSTAKTLQIIFSNYDILSRFGGDEFCLLVKEIPADTLKAKLDWTIEKLNTSYQGETVQIASTVSIGVAFTGTPTIGLDELIERADKALYKAKNMGKNQYVVY